MFLAFLLFAVQLLFNLYAASVVTSVAYDGASNVASAGADSPAVRATEETRMREILGRYGDRVSFDWSTQDGNVALRVRAENPSLLLPVLGGSLPFTQIDREVVVRVEELQP